MDIRRLLVGFESLGIVPIIQEGVNWIGAFLDAFILKNQKSRVVHNHSAVRRIEAGLMSVWRGVALTALFTLKRRAKIADFTGGCLYAPASGEIFTAAAISWRLTLCPDERFIQWRYGSFIRPRWNADATDLPRERCDLVVYDAGHHEVSLLAPSLSWAPGSCALVRTHKYINLLVTSALWTAHPKVEQWPENFDASLWGVNICRSDSASVLRWFTRFTTRCWITEYNC